MSLKKKVTICLFVILVMSLGLEYGIERMIILPSFTELQTDLAIQNAQRCEEAIRREQFHLSSITTDWARWDDTYKFVLDGNDEYVISNLVKGTFVGSNLNLIYICDLNGDVVWGKVFDAETDEYLTLEDFPQTSFGKGHWLLGHDSVDSAIDCILVTKPYPMIISSRPILTSEKEGPIRGSLIMGRFLNTETIWALVEQTHVNFGIIPIQNNVIQINSAEKVSVNNKKYYVRRCDNDTIQVDHVLSCFDNHFLQISSLTPTDIISKGRATAGFSLVYSAGIAVLALIFFYVILSRTVLKRIAEICTLVKKIATTANLTLRTEVPGTDELAGLGHNINNMLDRLESNEKQLSKAKIQADSANKMKSIFLASMSHEIRTPLNSIIGFSSLLAQEELMPQQSQYINMVEQSAEGLLAIINDILDFSKIEAGEIHIEFAECSLEELLVSIESMLRPKAIEKGLSFEILQCDDLPKTFRSDPTRLRQCLINLVHNAIKFTSQGHVYVNVSMEKADEKEFIRFDVEDTGIGISPEQQQIIFDEFRQADESTSRKYGGTGLGLSITRKLTKLLDGKLSLNSTPDKGTTFTIQIPFEAIDDEESMDKYKLAENYKEIESKQEGFYSGNILVAEDTKANQMLIKLYLEKMGPNVTIVENGQDAVHEVSKGSYDMILMDMQMPVMNGYDAAIQIRKLGFTMPIIAVTANAMQGDSQRCVEAGCDEYLPKPLKEEDLLKVIEKFLSVEADNFM